MVTAPPLSDVHSWVSLLYTEDAQVRAEAQGVLVAAGRAAVPTLVAALGAEAAPEMAQACVAVLREIAPFASRELVETLASIRDLAADREEMDRIARRACQALGIPETDQALYWAEKLASADDRHMAAAMMTASNQVEFAPMLVAHLSDSNELIRIKAVQAFGKFGSTAVPLLRQVRRSRAVERRGALAALAEVDWQAIEAADMAALRRLVRIKLLAETPHAFATPEDFEWYALRTEDQAAVLQAFELSDPVPATMAMGSSMVEQVTPPCALRYVSPVLDGWTLVFGPPVPTSTFDQHRHAHELLGDELDGADSAIEHTLDGTALLNSLNDPETHCAELSRRFGEVHWYRVPGAYSWGGWCIAVDGKITRYVHEDTDGLMELGGSAALHPAEAPLRAESPSEWLDAHGFPPAMWDAPYWEAMDLHVWGELDKPFADVVLDIWRDLVERTGIPEKRTARNVAERASVGPHLLGPTTRMVGHGVLARTICGRERTHHGAIRI